MPERQSQRHQSLTPLLLIVNSSLMPNPQNARSDWSLKQKAELYILLCLNKIPRTERKGEGSGIRQSIDIWRGLRDSCRQLVCAACSRGRGFHSQTESPWLQMTPFLWKAQESSPEGATACPWARGVTQQEASQTSLPISLTESHSVTDSSHSHSVFSGCFAGV